MLLSILWLACCVSLVEPTSASAQNSIEANAILGRMSEERPGAGQGPTQVSIGLFVIDIIRVDDVDQSFTADFAIRVKWHDARLAADVPGMRTFKRGEIWHPALTAINQRRLWPSWEDVFHVDPEGNVLYRQRFWGNLTARVNLHDYPFDRNRLEIKLVTLASGPDDITLVLDETVTGRAPEFSLVDAAADEGQVEIGTYFFAPSATSMSQITYGFGIERYHAYFLWKVILPLAMIIVMSWMVFWMDPTQPGPQIGLSATALLTLIAYRFMLGSLVPRVSYLTRLDIFILGATVLVFLGMATAVVKAYFASTSGVESAIRIDRFARVLFPAASIGVTYVAFFAG